MRPNNRRQRAPGDPVPTRQIQDDSMHRVTQARQRRRTTATSFVDWFMNAKSIPFLTFKGIGIPPAALIFAGLAIGLSTFMFFVESTIFRLLGWGYIVKATGENRWNGQISFGLEAVGGIILTTLAAVFFILITSNIAYLEMRYAFIISALTAWLVGVGLFLPWHIFASVSDNLTSIPGGLGFIQNVDRFGRDADKMIFPPEPNVLFIGALALLAGLTAYLSMRIVLWVGRRR